MTSPAPSVNSNGSSRSQEASNSSPVLNATPTYWTETLSPSLAALPLPSTMSSDSSFVGGDPDGLGISGFSSMSLETLPAGEAGLDGSFGLDSVTVVSGEGAGGDAESRESLGSSPPHAARARAESRRAVRPVTFFLIRR